MSDDSFDYDQYDDDPLETIDIQKEQDSSSNRNEGIILLSQPKGVKAMTKKEIYHYLKTIVAEIAQKLKVHPQTVVTALYISNFDKDKLYQKSTSILATLGVKSCRISKQEIDDEMNNIFVPYKEIENQFDEEKSVPINFDLSYPSDFIASFTDAKDIAKTNISVEVSTKTFFSSYLTKLFDSKKTSISPTDGIQPVTPARNTSFLLTELVEVPTYNETNCPAHVIDSLVGMDFERELARRAAFLSLGNFDNALRMILDDPESIRKNFNADCAELVHQFPFLQSMTRVVAILFSLYKTVESTCEHLTKGDIQNNTLKRIILKAKKEYDRSHGMNTDLKKLESEINSLKIIFSQIGNEDQKSSKKNRPKIAYKPSTTTLKRIDSLAKINELANEPSECLVCGEEMPPSRMLALECGHSFCDACWAEYISIHARDVFTAFTTRCMSDGCPCRVGLDTLKDFLPIERYKKVLSFLVNEFVSRNTHFIWCGNPFSCRCGIYCENSSENISEVICRCNFRQCFVCKEMAHLPASCDNIKEWKQMESTDMANVIWMTQNTKKCPKCKVAIEKNDGCMHMTCKNCHHQFCWLCKGPWSDHGSRTGGYYSCNRYKEGVDYESETSTNSRDKDADEKYVHFFTRYNHHRNSITVLSQLCEAAKVLAPEYKKASRSNQFLIDAIQLLAACRFILKNSYVKGFYIKNNSEKELFSFVQANIEATTENLMRVITDTKTFVCTIQQENNIRVLTKVTNKNFKNFMDAYSEGGRLSQLAQ